MVLRVQLPERDAAPVRRAAKAPAAISCHRLCSISHIGHLLKQHPGHQDDETDAQGVRHNMKFGVIGDCSWHGLTVKAAD